MKIYEIKETDKEYPKELLKLGKCPKKLYVAGNTKILNNKCVAMVGARDNTEYGEYYATKFSKELSQAGITIVSGLAIGIDSFCHEASMREKGKTIAVLGSGLKNIYPKENIELANQIVENGGTIISEYPPETEADLSNFPLRNRIIAGLSKCVLVVEAKYRSGSSVTATNAFLQKKKVFCIPGKLGEKTGVGTNNLIKKGAKLVTDVNEILEELGEETINISKTEIHKKVTIKIPKQYEPIYKLIKNAPTDKNEIARKLQINISELNTKLTIMEIEGYIETLPGNLVQIKE